MSQSSASNSPMDWPHSHIFYDILAQSATPGFEDHARSLLGNAEQQISRMYVQPAASGQTHQQLVARVAALKYAVSPVRRLPADILLEIFRTVIHESQASSSGNEAFVPVFCLASVCFYWRQLVITAPRLWPTTMILRGPACSPQYLETTKTLLQRSSPYSLDITVRPRVLFSSREPPIMMTSNIMDIVVGSAHRWRRISVVFNATPFLSTTQLSGPLCHLCEIDFPQKLVLDQRLALFLDAPKLTRVRLYGADFTKMLLPWSQLTKLKLGAVASSDFLIVLEQCNSLVDLELDGVVRGEDTIISFVSRASVISMPHLHDLRIAMLDYRTFDPFFSNFGFPSLLTLIIRTANVITEPELGQSFPSFLQRCPALEYLEFFGCILGRASLGSMLLRIPSLTHLKLNCCFDCVDNAFFERLTYRATDLDPPAPCLQKLELDCVGNNYSGDAVLAMVRSRWWESDAFQVLPTSPRVARWKAIYISASNYGAKFSDEFKAAVAELCAEGLAFAVKVYNPADYDEY
ncbi:hypothetical protein MIND_00674300 [Mycena indigotica]|uniref:F-box domain-containing protein n=1 Tax=Mycena indigotica TaxID=2126181 RepID=A0A8H6SLB5_9AGAR|nr:uncharacterized protein MIND_00674300 [Mycena indigotica]KAF7301103.1 hypothetical protein MIND_00674300 [Mycena indigotica]